QTGRRSGSLDPSLVEDQRPEVVGVARVEPGGTCAVDDVEGPVADVTALVLTQFRTEHIHRQRWIDVDHLRIPLPLDLEEPYGHPDGVLVTPRGGQVHQLLKPLGTEIRVASVV